MPVPLTVVTLTHLTTKSVGTHKKQQIIQNKLMKNLLQIKDYWLIRKLWTLLKNSSVKFVKSL